MHISSVKGRLPLDKHLELSPAQQDYVERLLLVKLLYLLGVSGGASIEV